MKSEKSFLTGLTIVLGMLLVTACGGGGGSGSSSGIPTAGVSITTANAKAITSDVITSVDSVQGMSAGTNFLTGVDVRVNDSEFNYPDYIMRQVERLPALIGNLDDSSVTGIVVSETVNCPGSGSLTVTGDVADPNALSVGDSLTLTFNNCDDNNAVVDGRMSFTFTELSAGFDGLPPFTLGIQVILSSFSVSDGSATVTGNGDMAMRISEDLSGNASLLLSGNSLTSTINGTSQSLTDYRYEFTFDNLDNYSVDLQGTIASSVIGGSVSYDTTTPFSGNDLVADGNPTAGVLSITTSLDNSQARVTAQPDGINVLIEVDADGDATFETSIFTTWAELESL